MSRSSLLTVHLALAFLSAVALGPGHLVGAQDDGVPPSFGLGDLPEGVSFEPVPWGQASEARSLARALAASRLVQAPGTVATRVVRRPTVILVESGSLTFVDGLEGDAPAAMVRAGRERGQSSIVTPPGVALAPGDLLALPPVPPDHDHGYVSLVNRVAEPAVYLEVEMFPSSTPSTALWADSEGFAVERLDVAAIPRGSLAISLGRLQVDPGASLPLVGSGPVVLLEVDGTVELTARGEGMPVSVSLPGANPANALVAVPMGTGRTLPPGAAAFVPPGAAGAVRNTGPTVAAVLVVVFAAGTGGVRTG